MEIVQNRDLLFQIRTIISVKQVRLYGAVAKWCQQFGLSEEEKGRVNLSVDRKILTNVPPEEVQLFEFFRQRHLETVCEKTF